MLLVLLLYHLAPPNTHVPDLQYFYNETTQLLYLWYNGTGAPPSKTQYVVPKLKVLVNITGTQAAPVVGVTLAGLNFRDTAYTYLDPHGMPSGEL